MTTFEQQLAWIGAIADQAKARDKDLPGRARRARPLTVGEVDQAAATVSGSTARLNRDEPDDCLSAGEMRAARVELLDRAVAANRVSAQEASEIRAELRSGSARGAEVRDNPGGLRVLRDGEPVSRSGGAAAARFKLLSPEDQRLVAEEAMRANPELAEAVRREQAKLGHRGALKPTTKPTARSSTRSDATPPQDPLPDTTRGWLQAVQDGLDRREQQRLAWIQAVVGKAEQRASGAPVPLAPAERHNLEMYFARYTFVERHEAGHAVVAHALGLPVEGIDAGHSGHFGVTQLRGWLVDRESALMVLFAGIRAEQSHRAWDDELKGLWPLQDDMHLAEEIIASLKLSSDDEAALRTSILDRVDDLLARNMHKVDELAEALFRPRKLDRDQVAAILGPMRER